MNVLRERSLLRGEVEGSLGLGVGREPVLAVDLLVVGGIRRGEILMAAADVVRDVLAVDQDDLEVLRVDPNLALEVAVVLDDGLGTGGEEVGIKAYARLAAGVADVDTRR